MYRTYSSFVDGLVPLTAGHEELNSKELQCIFFDSYTSFATHEWPRLLDPVLIRFNGAEKCSL